MTTWSPVTRNVAVSPGLPPAQTAIRKSPGWSMCPARPKVSPPPAYEVPPIWVASEITPTYSAQVEASVVPDVVVMSALTGYHRVPTAWGPTVTVAAPAPETMAWPIAEYSGTRTSGRYRSTPGEGMRHVADDASGTGSDWAGVVMPRGRMILICRSPP